MIDFLKPSGLLHLEGLLQMFTYTCPSIEKTQGFSIMLLRTGDKPQRGGDLGTNNALLCLFMSR